MMLFDLMWIILILNILNFVVGCVFGYFEGKKRAYLEILEIMEERDGRG